MFLVLVLVVNTGLVSDVMKLFMESGKVKLGGFGKAGEPEEGQEIGLNGKEEKLGRVRGLAVVEIWRSV